MRRFLLLVLCAAVVLTGCKTARGVSDSDMMKRIAAEKLPMSVPDETFAVARVDLGKLESGVEELSTLAEELGGQPPKVSEPARVLVASLLRNPSRVESTLRRMQELDDGHLDGLDTSGTLYMALSTAGNEPLMRALRNRVPESGAAVVPRGLFVRLFLPSAAPETLRAWIEQACDEETYRCDVYERVVAEDRGVIVDVRPGSDPRRFERHGVEADLELPDDDPDFFGERTVPATAFLESDAAVGVYVRGDRLAELGALIGMADASRAMVNATISNRATMYHRGMAIAGGIFRAQSPEAREVYDSAAFVDFDDAGVWLDSVSGLTEHGAKVARAGQTPVDISSAKVDDPLVDAQYAYDLSAAREAAVTPSWMMPSDEGEMRDVAALLRDSGIWLYIMAAHNYPGGFGRGLTALVAAQGDEEAVAMQQLEYLNGMRLSLALEPDEASPFGVSPRGGFVAHFDRRADIDGWVQQVGEELRDGADKLPFPVELTVAERSDGREVQLWLGDVDTAAPTRVPSLMSAVVDMTRLRALLESIEAGPVRRAKMAAPLLETIGRLSLQTQRAPSALNIRLQLGGGEPTPLAMSDAIEPVSVDDGALECLEEARRTSGAQMESLDEIKGRDQPDTMVAFATEFELQRRDCEEAADEIDWMRARWLKAAGIRYANGLRFDEAAPVLNKACELGDEAACSLAERARESSFPVALTTVRADLEGWASPDVPLTVIDVDEAHSWRFAWSMGIPWSRTARLDDVDWSDERARDDVAQVLGDGDANGFPVMVHPAAEAVALGVMSDEMGEAMERRSWMYRRSRSGPVGMMVPVRTEGAEGLRQLEFLPTAAGRSPTVHVDVTTDGIDIEVTHLRTRKTQAPIDGCAKDGPTICPSESLTEIWRELRAAKPVERAGILERYSEAMRVSLVEAQFAKIDFEGLRGMQPMRVRLKVGPAVPFSVVADIAAAAERVGGDDIRLEIEPDVPNAR